MAAPGKSRRELFEEQLQDLQRDISSLSSKLAIPTMVTSARTNTSGISNVNSLDASYQSAVETTFAKDNTAISTSSVRFALGPQDGGRQQELERVTDEMRMVMRERDDALEKVERLKKKIEELEQGALEVARLKISMEALKQDNDALKFSLESSERLRVQQKELIHMLQKSQALMGEGSVASFHSISSISHRGEQDSVQPSTNSAALQVQSESTAAENKSWLSLSAQNGSYVRRGEADRNPLPTPLTTKHIKKSTPVSKQSKTPSKVASPIPQKTPTPSLSSKKKLSSSSKSKRQPTPTLSKSSASSYTAQIPVLDITNAASPSYPEILRTNPSLVPQASLQAYRLPLTGTPTELFLRPSYASQTGVGVFTGLQPPSSLDIQQALAGRPPLYPSSTMSSRPLFAPPTAYPPNTHPNATFISTASAPSLPNTPSTSSHKKGALSSKSAKKTSMVRRTQTPSKVPSTPSRPASVPPTGKVSRLIRPPPSPSTTFSKANRQTFSR